MHDDGRGGLANVFNTFFKCDLYAEMLEGLIDSLTTDWMFDAKFCAENNELLTELYNSRLQSLLEQKHEEEKKEQ
jgi:hypothetical protein